MSDQTNYIITEGERRGSVMYIHENYHYRKDRNRNEIIYMKCVNCLPPRSCPGRGKVQNLSFQVTCEHNHDKVDDKLLKVHAAKVSMKRKAETSSGHISLREIYNEEIKQHQEAKGQLTFAMLEPTLRKRRKRNYPTLPISATASIELLETMEDATFNRFYKGSVSVDEECCLIFMSPKLIEIMKHYDGPIFIDGTFKSSPSLFDSLVTIHMEYCGHFVPAAYFLMTCRTEELYTSALSKMKEFINHEGFNPSVAMSDWEVAFQNALRKEFPMAKVKGCWFHYAKSVYKKVQKLGMQREFSKHEEFRKHIQMFIAIPLLKENLISQAYLQLKCQEENFHISDETKVQLSRFNSYFSRYWLKKIEMMSVFGLKHKTNNCSEGFHSSLNKRIKVIHPNLWCFLSHLNEIINEKNDMIDHIDNGLPVKRRRKKTIIRKEEILTHLEESLDNEEISPIDFMRKAKYSIKNVINGFSEDDDFSETEDEIGNQENANE